MGCGDAECCGEACFAGAGWAEQDYVFGGSDPSAGFKTGDMRRYSGKLNVRTSPSLHRELVIRAAAEGISLNALVNQCFEAN